MEFELLKEGNIFYESLSKVGKRIYQPAGVFYWAGAASKAQVNATIGSAKGKKKDFLPNSEEDDFVLCYCNDVSEWINTDKCKPEAAVAYAKITGMPYLRNAWKDLMISNCPDHIKLNPKLIGTPCVTSGISHGIFVASRFFLSPGEKIISPNKRWENYDTILSLQSGIEVADFKIFENNRFNVKGMLEQMEQCGKEQGKVVLILNFPNNPTGYICSKEEMSELKNTLTTYAKEHPKVPVVVLCDDAYDRYVYRNEYPVHSMFYELFNTEPNLIPIKLDGPSKYLLMYGARVGFMTFGMHESWFKDESDMGKFHGEVQNKIAGMVRTSISNANRFFQEVAYDLLKKGEYVQTKEKTQKMLEERYNALIKAFEKYNDEKETGLTLDPSGGGFFLFINVDPKIMNIDKKETGKPDTGIFAKTLLEQDSVGVLPFTQTFEDEKMNYYGLRFAFCSVDVSAIDGCVKKICDRARKMKRN